MTATNIVIGTFNEAKKEFILMPLCDFLFYEKLKDNKYKPEELKNECLKSYGVKNDLWLDEFQKINIE